MQRMDRRGRPTPPLSSHQHQHSSPSRASTASSASSSRSCSGTSTSPPRSTPSSTSPSAPSPSARTSRPASTASSSRHSRRRTSGASSGGGRRQPPLPSSPFRRGVRTRLPHARGGWRTICGTSSRAPCEEERGKDKQGEREKEKEKEKDGMGWERGAWCVVVFLVRLFRRARNKDERLRLEGGRGGGRRAMDDPPVVSLACPPRRAVLCFVFLPREPINQSIHPINQDFPPANRRRAWRVQGAERVGCMYALFPYLHQNKRRRRNQD